MGKYNIEKKSIGYSFLYYLMLPWHNYLYYRNIRILNKQNIPTKGSVIFTPNHQNALMDALALLFNIKKQLVFVARADIFKKKSIASILYFLKILPVYRIRDGFDSLKNNKETFDKTADVLKAGNGLVILPEGNHSGSHSLRPLKKGFARIAFQTEEANDFNLNIQIVPVGIDYNDYHKMRENLILNFGSAIKVSDYKELYLSDQPKALNKIREDLSKALSNVMIDIKSKEHYQTYENVREIYSTIYAKTSENNEPELIKKFYSDQKLVEKLYDFETNKPSEFDKLEKKINEYYLLLKKEKINKKAFNFWNSNTYKTLFKLIGLLILFPIYLYNLIFNLIPFQTSMASSKILKDEQFQSSFKFVVSFLIFPIFYILEILLLYNFIEMPVKWYVFLGSQIILAPISLWWHKNMGILYQQIIIAIKKITRPTIINRLNNMKSSIIKTLNTELLFKD